MKEEVLEPILRKIRINKIKRYIPKKCVMCDLGCGIAAKYPEEMGNYPPYGYGFDAGIRSETFGNYTIKTTDISKSISLDDKPVDRATLLPVLEHPAEPIGALSECYRVLKSEGKNLLTASALISRPILEFSSYKLDIVNPRQITDHKHYYSCNELGNLPTDAGFKGVGVFSFELRSSNCAVRFRYGCKS